MKIKVQKVPKREVSIDDTIIKFCLYFPQYKYHEARKLPFVRVVKMLKVAERERAFLLFQLTNIAAAPHTKKGSGVKRLLDIFKRVFED